MAQAKFSTLGGDISVRIQLRELSVDDRRAILRQLLHDEETCHGASQMTVEERREAFKVLDRFCGRKNGD